MNFLDSQVEQTSRSEIGRTAANYPRHRYPPEIICHTVWLAGELGMSLRDVERVLAERGVSVTYETIRKWCLKFPKPCPSMAPRRRPHSGISWYIEEDEVTIHGRTHRLWRGMDLEGDVLDIFVQAKRDISAVKRFFRKVFQGMCYVPQQRVPVLLEKFCPPRLEDFGAASTSNENSAP